VRTAGAFSTLGILRDPVLSTMIPAGAEATGELANVILHESVHATLFLPGQSAFNESLASFVADRLTIAYLRGAFGPKDRATLAWAAAQEGHELRVARMRSAYDQLDALYHSSQSAESKRAEKERVLGELREELQLKRPINNATLAGFRTYGSGTVELQRLLAACGGSWPRFFRSLGTLVEADFERARRDEIGEVVVPDAETAERLRFLGSPTIRVDGRDVEPGADARTAYVLACRIYRTEHGLSGVPDERWVTDALAERP